MLNKLAIRSILKLQHISPYFLVYLYTAEVDIVNDHVSRPLNCQKKPRYTWSLKGKFAKDGKFLAHRIATNNNLAEHSYIVSWPGEYKKVSL